MRYEDIDSGIRADVEVDMDATCPECGEKGVTGNGVCLDCLLKIVRNEPMKTTRGRQAQVKFLEIQENTRRKIVEAAMKKQDSAGIGHNSGISGERLRSFVMRIEKLNEDREAIGEDLKEVYCEAKGVGFDAKIIRELVRLRKTELEKRREHDELLDLYKAAIGMEV